MSMNVYLVYTTVCQGHGVTTSLDPSSASVMEGSYALESVARMEFAGEMENLSYLENIVARTVHAMLVNHYLLLLN